MKTQHYFFLSALLIFVYAGPARRDCGLTKTFEATNACGMTYGGSWVECTTGITAMPTFPIPSCSDTTAYPTITPAPLTLPSNKSKDCQPLMVCVDAIAYCGSTHKLIETCYDSCSGQATLSTPSCTLPLVKATPTAVNVSVSGHREVIPACLRMPALCAPPGW